MKTKIFLITALISSFLTSFAHAEWSFEANGEANALYGYSNISGKYKKFQKNNNIVTDGWISFSASNNFYDQYELNILANFLGGTDKYLKDYNQGSWGEELYAKIDTPYGQFSAGQMNNIAYLQSISAPTAGALSVNNSNITNFIHNPNWIRRKKTTSFRTLNSTYINTDGTSAKISYLSPEFYNTSIGFSYVPYVYNKTGLVNKHASYHNNGGIILSAANHLEFDYVDIETSLGYAEFFENDKEYSAGISFYRKGFTFGTSYRATEKNNKKYSSVQHFALPEYFDSYRNGRAFNIGLGYEIGPFKTAVTYFNSKAKHLRFEDKIVQFSNEYRIHKNVSLYMAVAHVEFKEEKDAAKGYAFIFGTGINF